MKSVMAVLMFLGLALQAPAQQAQVLRLEAGGAFLGIQMEDVTPDNMATYKLNSERGVIVRSVEKGSPAEAAGVQEKDVILEYAGTPVFSSMELSRLVRETPPGRKVDIAVSRDGKRVALSAKVAEREGPLSRVERGFQIMPRGDSRGFAFSFPPGMEQGLPFGGELRTGRPRLGVSLQPLTDQMAAFFGVTGRKGVLVTSVTEGSAAAGKLRAGDVIVSADGQPVNDPEDLTRIVQGKNEGALDLKVIRDKKEVTVSVTLPGSEEQRNRRSGGYRL